jgi:hypothetical protein
MKKDKKAGIEFLENKNNMVRLGENEIEKDSNKEKQSNEDDQWDINEKLLLDSFEEEEEEFTNETIKEIFDYDASEQLKDFMNSFVINETIKEIFDYDASEQLKDFMNSFDDEGIHNLENATEAMEVDIGKSKRARHDESSIKMKEKEKDHLG